MVVADELALHEDQCQVRYLPSAAPAKNVDFVRSEDNPADEPSRWKFTDEWKLHPAVFRWVNRELGPCTLDLFASLNTAHTTELVNCTPPVATFLSAGLGPTLALSPLGRRRRLPPPPLPEPSVPVVGLAFGVVFRAGRAFFGTLLLGAPFGGMFPGIVCQS